MGNRFMKDGQAANRFLKDVQPEDNTPTIDPRSHPLTWDERLKATLLFDDNPKRRASYMKRIGFEVDPKDSNKVRPLGSQGGYDMEIDPGGLGNISQYYKDGKKSGLKEAGLDAVEALDSFFQGAAEEAAGLATGAAAAGTTGIPTGGAAAVPGFMAGRSAGRATANYLLNEGKEALGNLFLDEQIPVEYQDKLFKAAVTSVAPEAIAEGGKMLLGAGKTALKGLQSGFKALLNIGGGNVSEAAMDALVKDPKTFANADNLKNATTAISEKIGTITGLGPEEGIPKRFRDLGDSSLFKTKMSEAENLRRDTVNTLSGVQEANTTVQFLTDMLEQAKAKVMSDKPIKSKDTQSIATQFDDYISQIKNAAGPDGSINFKQLDNTIKEIQTDAYGSEGAVAPALRSLADNVNGYAKKLATTASEQRGLDIKDYAASKAQEAKIFNAFESFSKNVTPQKVVQHTIGAGDKAMRGTGGDITKQALTNTFSELDDALGTQITPAIQTGQLQAELFRAIESSKIPRGSGGAVSRAAIGAAPGLLTGNTPLALGGAAAGVIAGDPSMGLRAVGSLGRQIGNIDAAQQAVSSFQQGAGGTTQDMLRAALQGGAEAPTNAIQQTLNSLPEPQKPKNRFLSQ